MGLRGPRNNAQGNTGQSPTEYPITPRATQIFRKMRRLETCCECPDDLTETPDWTERLCAACNQWWKLNGELNTELHTGSFPVYENPAWQTDDRPKQSAIDRFYALERASQAGKPRRFKYKWER
jgi:hypothetical protein